MLELLTPYTFSQVPNIAYEALDQYAEAVVRDAMPDKLTAPCPIDIAWFLEIYLGMEVMYRRLSYDRQIQAMTAFNSGFVQVCDEATGKPEPLYVKAGTAIFDPVLLLKRNTHRHRFSYGHEGSHYLIHRPAFAKDNPFGSVGKFENQYLAAKEGRIDYSRSNSERNDIEIMERQADFLAAALSNRGVTR